MESPVRKKESWSRKFLPEVSSSTRQQGNRTTGREIKLFQCSSGEEIKKKLFGSRVDSKWNALPNRVLLSKSPVILNDSYDKCYQQNREDARAKVQ